MNHATPLSAPATSFKERLRWERPGDWLLGSAFLLLAISTVMVFSASAFHGSVTGDPFVFLRKQFVSLSIAALVGFLFSQLDYTLYRRYHPVIFLVTIGLLVLVWVPPLGHKVNNSWRWIRFGSALQFQPSELAKLAVILSVAGFLSNDPRRCKRFLVGFVPVCAAVLLVVGLILVQPDLGASVLIITLAAALLVLAGVRWFYLLSSALVFVPTLAYFVHDRWEMVQTRLQGVLDPDKVYQVMHSLRALGSGGWFGVGLGASGQKLKYLPEAHTDFILAVIGEELGFVGSASVVLLFLVLVAAGGAIAWRCRDFFGFLVAAGITLSLGMQAAINISVVTASAPTKGMALPLVTFGGSGLCMAVAQVGILLSISRRNNEEVAAARRAPGRIEETETG